MFSETIISKIPLVALVVDDIASIRWLIVRRLKEMGFNVIIEASDGILAIEVLSLIAEQGKNVSLIISDLYMPKLDGVEFFKLVKTFPEFQGIPFLLCIPNSGLQKIKNISDKDVPYVLKPFCADDFKFKVREILINQANQVIKKAN